MRVGTLTKFNRKKNLWISRKHPLYLEPIGFKTLYAAAVLMHTRLNNSANPLSNFELERLITKGLNLTSKDTITMMHLSKEVELLVDEVILALDTTEKKLFFLFDLYNVSMSQYHISESEQKSIDLFADLLEIDNGTKNLILQFISSSYCEEYAGCLTLFEQMQKQGWPLSMTDLSYYMLNYYYMAEISPKNILPYKENHFHGNCTFFGTIVIPKNTTLHIANAIVKVEGNFLVKGGSLLIENSWVEFSKQTDRSHSSHFFIQSEENGTIQCKNTTFECAHSGGLILALNSNVSVSYCTILNTSFSSSIVCNGDSLVVKNSTFGNCFSSQNGGAIFIQRGSAQIQHSQFYNCSSHNGGAIFANATSVIDNCYFEHCYAVEFGSAIYYNGEIRSNVEKCDYSNCHPKETAILQYIGGRQEFIVSDETTIRYSTIFDCPVSIKEFGILQVEHATLYLHYTLICHGILHMKNVRVQPFEPLEGRDLIAIESPKNCHFTNCDFNGMEQYGIFRATRARLHISGCIFRNTANGRAIYNAFQPMIDGCVFSYCEEGAVYCNSGKITNSQFINCRAKSGAGIIMYGNRGQIEHCDFHRCVSDYSGGAIDISGSYHIVDCHYKECKPNNVS